MLADNLCRFIAFDAASARVPAGHNSIGIEHVDRIVLNAVHKEPEPLLALPQTLFVPFSLRQIARDLGIREEGARVVSERGNDDVCPEPRAVFSYPPPFVL